MSIGRLHWNWNEAHQPRQPAIMNGRLHSAKTAPVPARNPAPTHARRPRVTTDRPGRQPPAASQQAMGSANIAGYSLNPAPIPNATTPPISGPTDSRPPVPRSTARNRIQQASTVQATANRSQLWNAYNTSGGARANHQDRSPASHASIAADSSPATDSSSAENVRNSPSVSDGSAASQIATPVSTGYSTAPPYSSPRAVSYPPCTYGTTCSSMSRPIQRNWMSV